MAKLDEVSLVQGQIASWCMESVLLGLDLTVDSDREEWLKRTTFFDDAKVTVIFDKKTRQRQPSVGLLSEYRWQLDELTAIASRKTGAVGLQGWVMSRVIEMAIGGQSLEKVPANQEVA